MKKLEIKKTKILEEFLTERDEIEEVDVFGEGNEFLDDVRGHKYIVLTREEFDNFHLVDGNIIIDCGYTATGE